jgi:hypothetical protein
MLLGGVLMLWLFWALFTFLAYDGPESSGPAGDKFGGITALFSGLAFAGLVFTLFVQKKELQYQREELSHLVTETRETKHHLRDQATHLKSQSEFIERQIFENSFFQLMASFNGNLQSMTQMNHPSDQILNGKDALELINRNIARSVRSSNGMEVGFDTAYTQAYEYYKNNLGPYFRQMYNILKFIGNSGVTDKKFYSDILRAQLSSAELSLLAYNCASSHGNPEMHPLVMEFELLKFLDEQSVQEFGPELLPLISKVGT